MQTLQPTAARPTLGDRTELLAEIDAIRNLLQAPSAPGLDSRIAEARTRWPNDIALRLLEGETHERHGQPQKAEACYRASLQAHPANPWPAIRLFNVLLSGGRLEAALRVLAEDVWCKDLPERTRLAVLSQAISATGLAQRGSFLQSLLRDTSDDRFVLLKLATIAVRERDRSTAMTLFEKARGFGPLPVESELLEVELLLSSGNFGDAASRAIDLYARHPARIDFARRAIQAAHLANRINDVAALLAGALSRWPSDWLILFRYNRAGCPEPIDRELFSMIERHEPAMGADDRWLFQFAIACLRQQQTARAMALLERFSESSAVAPLAAPLRASLATRPAAAWTGPRGVTNDNGADIQAVWIPDSRATVIVVGGVQQGLGYLPFSHIDAVLTEQRVSAIYLHNIYNRAFLASIRGLESDHSVTTARLRGILPALGNGPVVVMGSSLAGLAAVRIALDLGTSSAISFAAPVSLTVAALGGGEDSPERSGIRRSIFGSFGGAERNIAEDLREKPATRLYHCFGEGYAPDVEAAALLRGLPNVELIGVPGCHDHFVVEHMLAGPRFAEVLNRAIAGGAP